MKEGSAVDGEITKEVGEHSDLDRHTENNVQGIRS
jgi:hypothetical protein